MQQRSRDHTAIEDGEAALEAARMEESRIIKVFGRSFRMPRSRWLRILIGILLVIGGILGFLPILGFWMIPLGILVLSYEFASVRRFRRRGVVWWGRRRRPT